VKILLSNDDGYRAEGLQALREAIKPLGAVTVVAPDRNRSGASNSLTLDVPIRAARYDADCYYVNGTPTDCVHLAISGLFDFDFVVGGAGVALLMSGLAVIVATGDLIHLRRQRVLRSIWAAAIAAPALAVIAGTLFLPWVGSSEVATSLPARAIGQFFGDSFERRTNQPLRAVAGDPQLASLIALDAARPHLFLDAAPQETPWLSYASFNQTGGLVVWRASDTDGTPPPGLRQRFPGIVPEVPQSFEWLVNGRQPLLRIGWAIVRPKAP